MVKNAAVVHPPWYKTITPYFLLSLLIIAIQYHSYIVFVTFLISSTFLYGFSSTNPWPSEEKGLSAYSVFNEDQEEILGTLNAGRIDRELRGERRNLMKVPSKTKKDPSERSWGKGNKLS